MKKIILAILVLGGLWLGGTYVIGQTVESRLREQVAALELIPGSDLVRLELSDYDAGLLGAEARTCLVFNRLPPDLAQLEGFSGTLCDRADIGYGPLLFTDDGPALGLAYARGRLDLSALPEPVTAMVDQVFQGQPPITARTLYRFDGGLRVRAAVTPFQVSSAAGRASLGRLTMEARSPRVGAATGRFFITGRDLQVGGPLGAATLPVLDVDITVNELLGEVLPLMEMTLAANGLSMTRGGREQFTGDLTLRPRSRRQGDTLAGDLGLWLDGLGGDAVPPTLASGYLGLAYQGIDSAAAVRAQRLSRELDRLRIEMMVGALADDQVALEANAAQARQLGEELVTVLTRELLRPDRSGLTLLAVLDGDKGRPLTLDGRLDYRGLDGLNASLAELRMLPPAGLLRLVDLALNLDADPALLPPPLRANLAGPMQAGLVAHRDGRLVSRLMVRDGALTVNGEPLAPAALMAPGADLSAAP